MATSAHRRADEGDGRFEIDGTTLTLITRGAARLDALIALIGSAQRRLRLLYYIFAADGCGERVRDAAIEACRRGVEVSLLVDGFGSEGSSDDFFAPLREAGAHVCRFVPRYGRRYLVRNHQKIALADEDHAMVGGFNVEEGYFADDEPTAWRDLGLLVDGPAAAHLAGYYDALLAWADDDRATLRGLNRLVRRWSQPDGRLRWLLGGPTPRLSPWAMALRRDLRVARRLDLIAAYFAPNPGTLRRFGRLARRGTVRIVTAALSDNGMTIAAARHTYHRLLRRGAKVYEYQPSRLHTKLFVVDDVTFIGSANCDMRSLFLNMEIMLRVEDAALARALNAYVDGEIGQSREAKPALLDRTAGWVTRTRWSGAYFLVAVADYTLTRRLNIGAGSDRFTD